jgi:hypothetical protein
VHTTNYGVNGSDINELGQHLPPLQVYGKHEPHGSYARSAAKGLDDGRVKGLIAEFHRVHGQFPKRYFSASRLALRFSSFNVPGLGLCFLDIEHDGGGDRVE